MDGEQISDVCHENVMLKTENDKYVCSNFIITLTELLILRLSLFHNELNIKISIFLFKTTQRKESVLWVNHLLCYRLTCNVHLVVHVGA